MAGVLFGSDDLAPDQLTVFARSIGLELGRYAQCMNDPATAQRVATDIATVMNAGFDGLPCVWIGGTRILGFNRNRGAEPYQQALAAELHGRSPLRYAPWLGVLAALLVIAWSARQARLKRSR
jgi:hypothetical protein